LKHAGSPLIWTVQTVQTTGTTYRETHEVEVIETNDGDSAIQRLQEYRSHVVLIEFHITAPEGFRLISEIKRKSPGTQIHILLANSLVIDLKSALSAGASGFVLQTISPDNLVDAVQQVALGGTVIDPRLLSEYLTNSRQRGLVRARLSKSLYAALVAVIVAC
jgi:DNA-binding NarL/FixJ family response regulator